MVFCINVYNKYLLIAKFEYHFESTSICWIAKFGAPDHMEEEAIFSSTISEQKRPSALKLHCQSTYTFWKIEKICIDTYFYNFKIWVHMKAICLQKVRLSFDPVKDHCIRLSTTQGKVHFEAFFVSLTPILACWYDGQNFKCGL